MSFLDEFVRADPNQIDRRYIKGKLGPNQLLSDFGVDNVNDDKGRLQMLKKGQPFSWYID